MHRTHTNTPTLNTKLGSVFVEDELLAYACHDGPPTVWPDWAIYWTLGNFSKPVATISLPKFPTFLGNFCKGVKYFHFSSDIIFGRLFTGHTAHRVKLLFFEPIFATSKIVNLTTIACLDLALSHFINLHTLLRLFKEYWNRLDMGQAVSSKLVCSSKRGQSSLFKRCSKFWWLAFPQFSVGYIQYSFGMKNCMWQADNYKTLCYLLGVTAVNIGAIFELFLNGLGDNFSYKSSLYIWVTYLLGITAVTT